MNAKQGRRLDGYIRVSRVLDREGDSYITEKVQEERIRAWAVANGHEIIEMHHETDVSGGTMNRPKLNEVMARIDRGETDGVVVFNLSRFARTMVGSVELIHRINEQGALFASVSDGFDITTITGRMVLGILLSITTAERERIGEGWQTVRAEVLGRGIHVSAWAPFGYRRGEGPINSKTGKPAPAPLEVDELTGPYVGEIFRRRAGGASWMDLRDWLDAEGVPTVRGARWSTQTVMHIVRNRTYLGIASGSKEMPDGRPDSHPALIDEATWHAAQPRMGVRKAKASLSPLRGLVRCGSCRYTMSCVSLPGGAGAYQYACNSSYGCTQPARIYGLSINGDPGFDDAVIEMMWERLERIEFEGYDATLDLQELEDQQAALVKRRERDRQDVELEEALGSAEWKRHLAGLTVQIDAIQARIEETLRRLGRPDGRPVAELRADWESGEMTLEQKQRHLSAAIQAVFVKPGKTNFGSGRPSPELRRAKFRERFDIVWATDDPVDIPRQGRLRYVLKPWDFTADAHPDVPRPVLLQPTVVDASDTVG